MGRVLGSLITVLLLTGCASMHYRVYSNDERALAECEKAAGDTGETKADHRAHQLRTAACVLERGQRAELGWQYFEADLIFGSRARSVYVTVSSPKASDEETTLRELSSCWHRTDASFSNGTVRHAVAPQVVLQHLMNVHVERHLIPCLTDFGYEAKLKEWERPSER